MWNPFKKKRNKNVIPLQPQERSLAPAHPQSADVAATAPKPQYQAWSTALQTAGIVANKPCTLAEIKAFEQELGAELTPELRQLYLMHDGMQGVDDGMYRLLSLQEVREMADYGHADFTWFPSLANDDWKLRTFFSYDNTGNTNAAVYLKGPLKGCVSEWGGGVAPNLPTYRNLNQLLFRAANAVIQGTEIPQFEPPWSDYPAGPSPSQLALDHDRQLVASLGRILNTLPAGAEDELEKLIPTNRGYLESCVIYVTPTEDVRQLRPILDSDDTYVLENMVGTLKYRSLDTCIVDDDELRSWMRRLSMLVGVKHGTVTSHAIEMLGSFRSANTRRYIRYALDHCHPNYSSEWLKRCFQEHAEIREVSEERQEYRIIGESDWHPVGLRYGEPGEP